MDSAIVHTTQDIEKDVATPRTRKNTSKACSSCRKLKIRCRELIRDNSTLSCEHCTKLGFVCSWPEVDARKQSTVKSKHRQSSASATPAYELRENELQASSLTPDLTEPPTNTRCSDLPDQANEYLTETSTRAGRSNSLVTPHSVLQYYRYLGSTALVPGYKKISLKIANESLDIDAEARKFLEPPELIGVDVLDPRTNLPKAELVPYLLDAFFEYYGSNFCFLNRAQLETLICENQISGFLLCSIAALASRFCSSEVFATYFPQLPNGAERERWQYSLPFLNQAKKLLMPLLNIPSCDLVAGLLFLALAEFGDNNEAGMWMFTGMSIRVAQELGLHRQRPSDYTSIGRSPTNEATHATFKIGLASASPNRQRFEVSSQIILFWCVFVQESSLANGTGRVPGIKTSEISIRLPTDDDVAAVKAGPAGLISNTKSSVFPHMVRMMLEYTKSIEFLNTEYQPGNSYQGGEQGLTTIYTIRENILAAYNAVPDELGSGARQYRSASSSGQAIPYLVMHLNFFLQIAFLTQASRAIEEQSRGNNYSEHQSRNMEPNERHIVHPQSDRAHEDQLYRRAMKSVVDILTIARFVDGRPLLSTFFLNQAFFHAACAYAGDMLRLQHHSSYQSSLGDNTSAFPLPSHSSTSVVFDLDELRASTNGQANLSSAENYLGLLAKTNYQFLRQAITEMAKYYAGAGWVDAVLDQRESGIRDVDLSIVSESISTYIRLHDLRYTQQTSGQSSRSSQVADETTQYGGELMFSQDLLSNIPPDFDSQAFFNDYIFADPCNECE